MIRVYWERCDCCQDYICNLHEMHAHDCECPPVDDWKESPYDTFIDEDNPTSVLCSTSV
jgi:hypothetical protein